MQGIAGKILIFALAVGVTGCASSGHTGKVAQGVVEVIRLKGMARYSVDDKSWVAVKKGMEFKPEILVQTGPKSLMDLGLNGEPSQSLQYNQEKAFEPVVRIYENSSLRVSKLAKMKSGKQLSGDIEIELLAGQIFGYVKELAPEAKYEVKIPKGWVDIRGGAFMISSSGVINVLSGTVFTLKTNSDGSEKPIEIGPHESYDPATGTITRLATEVPEFPIGPVSENWPPPIPSTSGVPHGSGTGGALRKFQ